ncbi:MAG: HAMP domain-containing histidine kinase [Crocinitomicaceae bacterium]|nr:HAMP domain-containing histidine kinase [Crocinitomicaceae bacterium]
MTIRNKLTIQFTIIVASIILVSFVLILLISAQYRKTEFEGRLEEKAVQTARLFLDVDEVDSTLLRKIDDRQQGALIEERVTIINLDHQILYTTDAQNKLQITDSEIAQLKNGSEIAYEKGEIEVLGMHYTSRGKPYYIFVGGFDKFGKRKIVNLRNTLIVTWVISVIIMAIAGWLYAGRALKPVSNIIKEVDQINDRNLDQRINYINSKDELSRLATTFNNMLDRVEQSIVLEKNFLANASHELRNPLAAITAQLEVCLLNDRTSEEYKSTLFSVLEDISALNLLSHQLLTLTRIEAGITMQKYSSERIDQLIFDAAESKFANEKKLRIDFRLMEDSLSDENWEIKCSRELIISAFQNIIDNAAKFGATDLLIAHSFKNGFHYVSFNDNGGGIDSEDQAKIFEPFFRSKKPRETEGHGIGLSLVNRIVKLHDGNIIVNSDSGKGTEFIIILPAEIA